MEIIRNTPFLVQLFFIYFALPSLGLRLDPIQAAILAMTLNMAAYTTEIVGAGLDAVPHGQREAAQALGLKPLQAFLKVVMPQALKVIFPASTSQIIIRPAGGQVCNRISKSSILQSGDPRKLR